MQDQDRPLNYLDVLDSLRALQGQRVRFAIFERDSVTPVAVFPGVLGALEMSTGQYGDDVQGVAFVPFPSDGPPSPSTGPDGFYLDASHFETCVPFGPGLRIILGAVEIQVEPS